MIDVNPEEMSHKELQQALKVAGKSAFGSREVLIARYQKHLADSLTDPLTTPAEPISSLITEPEEVTQELANINISKRSMRMDKLIGDLEDFFAGRAEVIYDPNDETIHFKGGPRKLECVTTQQPDSTIMLLARRFISRAVTNEGLVGGMFNG